MDYNKAIVEKNQELLTNNSDTDSSIVSSANCVYRNTRVHSICLHSDIKHTWVAVTNKVVIKVDVIINIFRVGICIAV